jgi:hypothetical protein
MDGFARNLHAMNGLEGGINLQMEPTDIQRLVDSVHTYPFLSVIERRTSPFDHFKPPKRGTEW